MKVLVTGSTGFIGRRIVDRLREAGFEVRIASRHPDRVGHAGDVVPMPGFDAPEDAFLAPMSGVTHVVHAAAQNNDRDACTKCCTDHNFHSSSWRGSNVSMPAMCQCRQLHDATLCADSLDSADTCTTCCLHQGYGASMFTAGAT